MVRATAARQLRESVLHLVVSLLAAGLLCSTGVAWATSRSAYSAELQAVGAPTLLFDLPSNVAGRFGKRLAHQPEVRAVGAPQVSAAGTVASGRAEIAAALTACPGETLPRWVRLDSGSLPGPSLPGCGAGVWLERGAAASLGVGPGGHVRVSGRGGTATLLVSGVVGDLSQATYPLTTPAEAYLSPAAAQRVGLRPSGRSQSVVPAWMAPGATVAQMNRAIHAALPPGAAWSVFELAGLDSSLGFLGLFTIGASAVLALVALACLVIGLRASVSLEIRRDERAIGQLRATGWSTKQLRSLLVWQRLPAIVLGALAGALAGSFTGLLLAGNVTELYGSAPDTTGSWLVAVVAAAVVVGTGALSVSRTTRRVGTGTIAAQLRADDFDRARSAHPARLRARSAAGQLAAATVAARRLRSLAFSVLVALAVAAVVLGTVVSSTLAEATTRPSVWGYHYSWRVDLPGGASPAVAARQLANRPGVSSAVPFEEGSVLVGVGGQSAEYQLFPAGERAITPAMASGALPTSADGVAVGSALAASAGLRVGERVTLVGESGRRNVVVTGVARYLENDGTVLIGTTGLDAFLADDTDDTGVLLSCAPAGCPGLVSWARAEHPGWALSGVQAQLALPFGGTVRFTLDALELSVVLLALAIATYSGLAIAEQLRPAYGLARALGASRGQLARAAGIVGLVLTSPALAVGLVVGVAGSSAAVRAVSASVGGFDASVPGLAVALLALAVGVLGAATFVGPLLRSSGRVPVRALGR